MQLNTINTTHSLVQAIYLFANYIKAMAEVTTNEPTKNENDDILMNEISTGRNDISAFENPAISCDLGTDNTIMEGNMGKSAERLEKNTIKQSLDKMLKRKEGRFYLHTSASTNGEEGPQIVAGEWINEQEIRCVTLPDLNSYVVDKKELQYLSNNHWKPVEEKKERMDQFLHNLLVAGDIQLIQKAFNQFTIIENVYSNPFKRFRTRPPNHDGILHICARVGNRSTMDQLLDAKSSTFPLDMRSDETEGSETILHAAVCVGNYETVQSILGHIPPVSDTKARRGTLSHLRFGSKDAKSEHNKGEGLINLQNDAKNAAIHIALNKLDYQMFLMLLENNADISVQDRYGNNVLHIAAKNDDITAVEMIVRTQQDKGNAGITKLEDVISEQNKKMKKPAELAKSIEILELLLNCYCDENQKSEEMGKLLASASATNKLDLATYLIKKGASIDFDSEQNMSTLELASKRGKTKLIDCVLQSVDEGDKTRRRSINKAINSASQSGHIELIELLLKNNANLWDEESMQTSALHSAVNGGQLHLISFLIKEHGMDPNIQDNDGKTPLYYAVKGSYNDCVKELLNYNADPELAVDHEAQKAIHLAVVRNDKRVLKVLLEYGTRSDEKNMEGKTPMDIALENDYPYILELLLEYHAGFDREDEENNNPMHIIATHGSYKCADLLLRDAEVQLAFEQLKAENVDGETPVSIAKRKGNKGVLTTFIEKVPIDYFDNNAKIYHRLLEEKQFDVLKTIFNRMCEETNGGTEMHCRALMLDTNGKGQTPFSRNFSHLLPSLMHKLVKCGNKELREHPIVKKTAEKKLNFYVIWYLLSFLIYLAFIVVFSLAIFMASYECEKTGNTYTFSPKEWGSYCEVASIAFVCLQAVTQFIEFAYGYLRIVKVNRSKSRGKRVKLRSQLTKGIEMGEIAKIQKNNLCTRTLERGKRFTEVVPWFNRTFCYLPQGILHHIYSNALELLGILSFFIYLTARLKFESHIAWLFASLSYISFTISLLEYTRVIPSLGAYIATVKAVFSKDIPRFLVLYAIVLIAYIGGTHLAARFEPIGGGENGLQTNGSNGSNRSCQNNDDQLFYFNDNNNDVTANDTLLTSFVSGLGLLKGEVISESEVLNVNPYFAIIYNIFSFTIIVVLSSLLTAQLARTYARLSAQGTFYYQMGLIVSMELESSLAFFLGKYFRQLSSIKSFNVSIDEWKELINELPEENINRQLNSLLHKINKNSGALYDGNEKVISHGKVLDRLGEKVTKILGNVDSLQLDKPVPASKKRKSAEVSIDERMEQVEANIKQISMQSLSLEDKLEHAISLLKNH